MIRGVLRAVCDDFSGPCDEYFVHEAYSKFKHGLIWKGNCLSFNQKIDILLSRMDQTYSNCHKIMSDTSKLSDN